VAWAKPELGVVALVETDAIASGNESDGSLIGRWGDRSEMVWGRFLGKLGESGLLWSLWVVDWRSIE
jgi:hypothetical protein